MKKTSLRSGLKRIAVGALAASALTLGLPATPAFAMNAVACGNRTDFLKLSVKGPANLWDYHCYANTGRLSVDHWNVHQVTSGNNKVDLTLLLNNSLHIWTLGKWSGVNLNGVHVVGLQIV